jgi:hypothetical protein
MWNGWLVGWLVGLCSGDGVSKTIVAALGLTKEAPESIGRWVGK